MSMSPQLENGYTRLANEIIEALMRTNLSAYQSRILWAIWRQTYGYHKKADWISHTELAGMTGLKKPHVSRTISELMARNIVTRIGNKIAFNKDYQGWRELPKRVTDTNPGNKITDWGYRRYQSGLPQKKKYIKKDASSPEVRIAIDHFHDEVLRLKKFKPMIAVKDAASVKRLLARATIEQIKAQIDFFLRSDKANEHITLASAMSADTYNKFMLSNHGGSRPQGYFENI